MNSLDIIKQHIIKTLTFYNLSRKNKSLRAELGKIHSLADKLSNNNSWISVDDDLPTQSDQYWVAYRPISNYNPNEKTTETCYCTAHFNELTKEWSVKDQLFYTQRQCKVLFWQPMPQPPKE